MNQHGLVTGQCQADIRQTLNNDASTTQMTMQLQCTELPLKYAKVRPMLTTTLQYTELPVKAHN
jgi:hypothetical protein